MYRKQFVLSADISVSTVIHQNITANKSNWKVLIRGHN